MLLRLVLVRVLILIGWHLGLTRRAMNDLVSCFLMGATRHGVVAIILRDVHGHAVGARENVVAAVRPHIDVLRPHQSSHLRVLVQLSQSVALRGAVVVEVDHIVGSST